MPGNAQGRNQSKYRLTYVAHQLPAFVIDLWPGVDKVLLRQRAAELQQICNEISAVRESQGKTTRSVHESTEICLSGVGYSSSKVAPPQ